VRNSSLVKRFCAEDVTGLKHITEAAELVIESIGRGAFYTGVKEDRKKLWTY